AMDRTAYPRPGERLTREELDARYSLNETDHAFIRATARGDAGRLTLATLLKARQDLGCFPAPLEVQIDTVAHLASQLYAEAGEQLVTTTVIEAAGRIPIARRHMGRHHDIARAADVDGAGRPCGVRARS